MIDPFEIIQLLKLIPHPEGGYYREVYRSDEIVKKESLPIRYNGNRSVSTSIYYMLVGEQVSRFHRLKSDEIWHFYLGSQLIIHILDHKSGYEKITVGNDLNNGELPQLIIQKEKYFSAEVSDKNSFSLIGCTVAPGFDFNDFEFGQEEKLINSFPEYAELIKRLCKK
jgi:hypothetical protein